MVERFTSGGASPTDVGRLALVTTETALAGAERVVLELARALSARGASVRVISLQDPGDAPGLHTACREAGIAFESCSINRKTSIFVGLVRLRKALQRFDPHLVHAHLFHANAACAWTAGRMANCPVVATHHIVERRVLPWRYRIDRMLDRYLACHVAVSHAVAEHQCHRTGIDRQRFRVIHNGTALPEDDRSTDCAAVRRRLGVPDSAKVLLSVGRLDPQKGFVQFVPAARELLEQVDDMVWAIAGEGPLRGALTEAIARAGLTERVRLPGYVTDVDSLYRCAEALVMPSRWEGFGLAAVEAMARGCPVAAARVDSLPEIIDDGETGLLFDPDHPLPVVAQWLASPERRRRQAEAARRIVVERFSLRAMVDNYAQLYGELTGRTW